MTMSTMYIYWTEQPPTMNNLYLNVYRKGRVIAPAYRVWMGRCPPEIGVHRSELPITERFAIQYYIMRPDRRKRDIANLEKALTDSLVKHQIIKDDSLMEELHMQWGKPETNQKWAVKAAIKWGIYNG